MNWLPAEPEKVEFFEEIGLPLRLIPRRIYCGMVGNQKRYFALKLPLAVDPKIVTFAYVDPGHQTDTELYSWEPHMGRFGMHSARRAAGSGDRNCG